MISSNDFFFCRSGFLDAGINRIVDQVVNPNVLATVVLPEVEEVVYSYFNIPRPVDRQQKKNRKLFVHIHLNDFYSSFEIILGSGCI